MSCAVCDGALGEDTRTTICSAGHEHLIHGTTCFEELKQRHYATLPKIVRLKFPVRKLHTKMLECPRPGCIKRLESAGQRVDAVAAEQAVAPPAAFQTPSPGSKKSGAQHALRIKRRPGAAAAGSGGGGDPDDGCPYCLRPLSSACRIVCCSIPEHRRTFHEKCFDW
jgi:hypothetical protein